MNNILLHLINNWLVGHFLAFISEIYYYILDFVLFCFYDMLYLKRILAGHEKEGYHWVQSHGAAPGYMLHSYIKLAIKIW